MRTIKFWSKKNEYNILLLEQSTERWKSKVKHFSQYAISSTYCCRVYSGL